jgi:predicted dinucleotide-binding enzyme
MRITTIGRGTIGGTLARLWTAAGHDVTQLGRDGGDAADADVVLVAVPNGAVPAALDAVTGLRGKVVIDATNRLGGESAPAGHASVAEYVKATTGGPTAKAFNLNFGTLFDRAGAAERRPSNLWVGDEEARAAVEQLTRDMGMAPVHGGPLERAAAQEAFAPILMSIVRDVDAGLLFYRFAAPDDL